MSPYAIALFLHVVGALGLFAGLALEWLLVTRLRGATTGEGAREWMRLFSSLRILYGVALATILIAGIFMAVNASLTAPWVGLALVALILLAAVGGLLTGRGMATIGPAVGPKQGMLTDEDRIRLRDPRLWISVQLRTAIALGIVFLMTVKPDLIGSLIALAISFIIGVASSVFGSRGREEFAARPSQA
jgi:hypothetical protein